MGVGRRFFTLEGNSIFKFKIDTRLVVPNATNGAENSLQFILPIDLARLGDTNFVLKVSDGRTDIVVDATNFSSAKVLQFNEAGVYDIEMVGRAMLRFSNMSPDAYKIIYVSECGPGFNFNSGAFDGASNMIWDVATTKLNTLAYVFYKIKGFGPNVILNRYDVSSVEIAYLTFSGIINPLTSVFQGFFLNLTNASQYLKNTDLSLIPSIDIIAPNLTNASEMLSGSLFQGQITLKSDLLTNIDGFMAWVLNPVSLGNVDIRRVTTAISFITYVMSTANVDATLIGWQNNFDWSVIPSIPNKVIFDFYNSKYSNNPAVIAAKSFLESKGIVFNRLTIA